MNRQRTACLLVGALLVAAVSNEATAQNQAPLRAGQQLGPRFMVPILKSTERSLGAKVADVIRERMGSDYMMTQLYIVPKSDIDGQLEASGYSKTEALAWADLKMLAQTVRAEEYLDGTVTRDEAGNLSVQTSLVLPRTEGMIQPLPVVTGNREGDVAARVSREISNARKQIPHAARCITEWRQNRDHEAVEAARRAIREYENSVFGRLCLLEIGNNRKWGADSIIKYAEEILAIHPENRRALPLVADAYNEKGMEEKYIETLTKLLAADPTNSQLQLAVVNALGAAGKPEVAKPIIDEAVKQNPGSPDLIRLQWDIYRTLRDWKGVVAIGEEMIKSDTAAADTLFWQRLVAAYVSDSQPQKAQEAAARGAAKFPNNATLWITVAQLARQNGQLPQALEAINKVLAIDPKYPGANLQKAQIYSELDQVDSLMTALRVAIANGANKETAGGMALTKANQIFRAYQQDSTKTVEQGEHVLSVLAAADSMHSSDNSVFLMGATQLYLGQTLLTRASETRSCDDAKRANDLLIDANLKIGKAGRSFGEAAANAMQGAMQLQSYADQAIKALCRS